MAINIDTQDLQNYPGNVKRVTLDQESLVPQDYEGDEQFVLNFSTSAYSDNTSRTAIQDYYITGFKSGWCKSSGFKGTNFALDSSNCSLEIKIDSTTSGISDGYYRVTLSHEDGLPITGDSVAADLESKIRDISLETADTGYEIAYANAVVEFQGGKFWIISGSAGNYYTGSNKSSVKVRPSSDNDCSELLGFDLYTSSEAIASTAIKEAYLTSDYTTTGGIDSIDVSVNIGASVNDCLMLTDRTNTDYLQITTVSGSTLYFDGSKVDNNYSANVSKVQLLREQDPDADPTLWFDSIDKISRHGIKVIMSQIDYSS